MSTILMSLHNKSFDNPAANLQSVRIKTHTDDDNKEASLLLN